MNTHLTIITGASRGLGLALAEQRLRDGHRVLAIARRAPPIEHPALTAWACDLADAAPVAGQLQAWLAQQADGTTASLTLINNAGVVSQLAPLGAIGSADLANALRVGLEAPTLLAAAFLRASAAFAATVQCKLLFISSGLGRRAMAGSASYCAAKAGLDHLARAIALEQAALPGGGGVKVVSLAPGVIDTDMQAQLRSADAAAFPERERFIGLRDDGQLDSPAAAAAKVLRMLDRADFGQQPVADVRDA